jgi:hypothetical protein
MQLNYKEPIEAANDNFIIVESRKIGGVTSFIFMTLVAFATSAMVNI